MKVAIEVGLDRAFLPDGKTNLTLLEIMQKEGRLNRTELIYSLLLALDFSSEYYLKMAKPTDESKEAFRFAKQVNNFSRYLVLENQLGKYKCTFDA